MKQGGKYVLLSLGLLVWVLSAIFDYALMPTQSFLDWLIFKVPTNELIFRVVTLTVFALAAVILAKGSPIQESAIEELKKSNHKYVSLLKNLQVGVYRIEPNGRILEANRRFAEILGYEDAEELKNVNMNEVYVNKPDRQAYLEKLRESPVVAEIEILRKDGRTIWVQDYPRAILDPIQYTIQHIDGVCVETHGIEAIMRDITEHKRLQSMKDHFIVTVTHDLRTPLVSIKGYMDHIIEKEPNLSSSLRSKIEIVRHNTNKLLELTDDLLNIQDTEEHSLGFKFETLNLQDALTQCLEEIQPLVRDKRQEIRLEVPGKALPVVADGLRLNQVLTNILDNASKFTPDGGTIIIRVEEEVDDVAVSITDSGIGIDQKDLKRVFEPFAIIEKPTYFKGTGVGLSLTKKLVEAQGGKVWATSIGKGRGATFAFTLPKSKEEWIKAHG
jgi:PAS domain S-box-containing protein